MKNCVIVSDSFKGSLSSIEICGIARECVKRFFPQCKVTAIPVADGGEGTADCFLHAAGGEKIRMEVRGPSGHPVKACYARIGNTAVVEMAQAAGLPLTKDHPDPASASTYGVGQLICHAVENGSEQVIVGLGGSATNDGGCGAAAAFGVKFRDSGGQEFVPAGKTLGRIASMLRRRRICCAM